jgi:hypothetical protein
LGVVACVPLIKKTDAAGVGGAKLAVMSEGSGVVTEAFRTMRGRWR